MPPLLQLSGRVFDSDGVPVAGATVEVDYLSAGGLSEPPSRCPSFCWLSTLTDDTGAYAVEFVPRPWPGRGLGYVYAIRDGYEVDVQWVPEDPSPVGRDLRLAPTRPLAAGQTALVSVGPSSSLCTDLEDLWLLHLRCETLVIEAGAGILIVEARSTSGNPPPMLYWHTSGEYAGLITRPAPGLVSIPVRGGKYRIVVPIPPGAPEQQFEITTALQAAAPAGNEK